MKDTLIRELQRENTKLYSVHLKRYMDMYISIFIHKLVNFIILCDVCSMYLTKIRPFNSVFFILQSLRIQLQGPCSMQRYKHLMTVNTWIPFFELMEDISMQLTLFKEYCICHDYKLFLLLHCSFRFIQVTAQQTKKYPFSSTGDYR